MDKARIYQPTRSVMQSGSAMTKKWVLEYTPKNVRYVEPLMGWVGSSYTKTQCQLKFDSLEEALSYANRNEIAWEVVQPKTASLKPKNYSSNFSNNRVQ